MTVAITVETGSMMLAIGTEKNLSFCGARQISKLALLDLADSRDVTAQIETTSRIARPTSAIASGRTGLDCPSGFALALTVSKTARHTLCQHQLRAAAVQLSPPRRPPRQDLVARHDARARDDL